MEKITNINRTYFRKVKRKASGVSKLVRGEPQEGEKTEDEVKVDEFQVYSQSPSELIRILTRQRWNQ